MRSLVLKLVLAFLVTSVAGIALASLLIRTSITRDFDYYLMEQRRDSFVNLSAEYYSNRGNWQGFDSYLRRQVGPRRPGAPSTKGEPVSGGPPRSFPLPFMLTDANGTVIIPFEQSFREGQLLTAGQLERGMPVIVDGQLVGIVITPERPPSLANAAEERYLGQIDRALALAALASVGIALGIGILLARLITRPVRELTTAAERIASGQLEQSVPVRSRDELGRLAAQFNRMSADLARATTMRRQMTADIAHDLRTPLTVIAGYLEALRDRTLKPTVERFNTLYGEVQLLLRLVDELHTLSLADAGELPLHRQSLDPRALLERVADSYQHAAQQHGIELQVVAEPSLAAIFGDHEHLARILGNLVSNALRHTPRGGRIVLSGRTTGQGVTLSVADTGAGIAPEHLTSLFERFYRADPARSQAAGGSGLGLAIVKSLVEAHGGSVGVISQPGQGATFTVTLPAA